MISGLFFFIFNVRILFGWLVNCLCKIWLVWEEFVKNKLLIFLWDVSVLLVLILFCIRLIIFVGRLVFFYNFNVNLVIVGVNFDGLNIMVLFVNNVGIIWLFGKWLGKLYGLNIVIILWGLWWIIVWFCGIGFLILLVCFKNVFLEIVILFIIVFVLVCVF